MEWIYVNNEDNSIRYVLGTKGVKPLICFGINPSTAEPNNLDPTLKKVEKIALNNDFDSWIMINVYPKRDTIFENLSDVCNDSEHCKNLMHIKNLMLDSSCISIWAGFGDHIYDRPYLINCWKDIYIQLNNDKIKWLTTGINKSGSPKHPLYQKASSKLISFDMKSYINTL